MKFYITFIVSISFFSSFLCNASELSSQKSFSIPEDIAHYFQPPAEKLKLPEDSHKQIVEMCNRERLKKEQNAITKSNVVHLQNKITKKQTKLNELTKNRDDLQKQCGTLLRQCIEQQEKQDKLSKECRKLERETIESQKKNNNLQGTVSSIQKQINLKKQEENRQIKKTEYSVLKSLKYQYSAQTIDDLSAKFDKLSSDIYKGLELNLKQTGPYFNENHLLIGSVNKDWIFVYCPCTSRIVISKESYSYQPDVLYHLPHYFECKGDCSNYRTSSSTDSDSDIENNEDQIVSKEQIGQL